MSRFATLRSCLSIEEAELFRAHLDSVGIRSFVRDAHTAANYGEAVIGGCRLEVLVEDAPQAESLLGEHVLDAHQAAVGNDVFRVQSTRASTFTFYAAFVVAAIFVLGQLLFPAQNGLILLVSALVFLGAFVLGHFRRDDYCATCRGALFEHSTICGRCQGVIRGDIAHPNERLDAEEEFRKEHPQ
jgi:hypothetical protein